MPYERQFSEHSVQFTGFDRGYAEGRLNDLCVVDPVPDHLSITAVHSELPYEVTGNVVTFHVPTLEPGDSLTFSIDTVTTDGSPVGELCNTAHLNDDEPTPSSIACIALFPNQLPTTGGKGIPEGGAVAIIQWLDRVFMEVQAKLVSMVRFVVYRPQ